MKGPARKSVRPKLKQEGTSRVAAPTPLHDTTFTYRFADLAPRVDCSAGSRGGTPESRLHFATIGRRPNGAGWSGRWGGRLQDGRLPRYRRLCRGGVRVSLARRSSRLGTGGAAVLTFPTERERVDCQVPSRCVCLSQRGGAAGPEWRRSPLGVSLALGQRLGQSFARGFIAFGRVGPRHITAFRHTPPYFRGAGHASPEEVRAGCSGASFTSETPETRGVALVCRLVRAVWP
jgi:hypothetical protein